MSDLLHFLTNLSINPSEQERFARQPMSEVTMPMDGLRIQDLTAVMGAGCFIDPGPDPDPDPDPMPPPSDS